MDFIDCGAEVGAVEGGCGFFEQAVGSGTPQGFFLLAAVVEGAAEADDFGVDEYVVGADACVEAYAVERAASAQCHVDLAAGEGSSAEVYVDAVECQALALVDGEGPGGADGVLGECALDVGGHGLVLAVVLVRYVFPHDGFDVEFGAVLEPDGEGLGSGGYDASEGAVDEAAFWVVAEKDDLCARFEREFEVGRVGRFGKFAGHLAAVDHGPGLDLLEHGGVDAADGIASRGQCHDHARGVVAVGLRAVGQAAVDGLNVGVRGRAVAEAVEYLDEGCLVLTVDFA